MTNPIVSVIVPCYNQAQYLSQSLDSVIAQTYPSWECIIVNDGSPDNTEEIALQYCFMDQRFRYLKKENGGLADARNAGIAISTGEYILPLDADDKISPIYLEKAITVLDARKEVKIIFGNGKYFGNKNDKIELWYFRDDIVEYDVTYFLTSNFIYCTSLFRRSDYNKTGGYNTNMKYGWEDWDFWLSLLETGGLAYKLLDVCFYYRFNANSMVHSITNEKKTHLYNQLYQNHRELYNDIIVSPIHLYLENKDLKRQLHLIKNSASYKTASTLSILNPFKFRKIN